jgi:hypothetical protein
VECIIPHVTIVHLPDDMATLATVANDKGVGAVGDTKSAEDKAVDVLATALLAAMVLDDKLLTQWQIPIKPGQS